MSPKDYSGYYKVCPPPQPNLGWWICYVEPDLCPAGFPSETEFEDRRAIYFYKQGWHSSMCDGDCSVEENYFPSREAALEEFFSMYPGMAIIDFSQAPPMVFNEVLNKVETWRDRPPLL